MTRRHLRLLCMLLIGLLLVNCQTLSVRPETSPTSIMTAAAATVLLQLTQTASVQTSVPELLPNLLPSLSPSPSPFPPELVNLLPAECDKIDEGVYSDFRWSYLVKDYGNYGCKLPMLSPNGEFLAYVRLTQQGNGSDKYFVDSVKILSLTGDNNDTEVHVASQLNYIGKLEFSSNGQLIIWEYIWEGPWKILIYDLPSYRIVAQMKLDWQGVLQWNPQHTAFYAEHSGEYGPGTCTKELGGYDFESARQFPDLRMLFNPTSMDNLSIEPLGWSLDGKQIWLTLTPLRWNETEYRYEVGPKQAGVLELSATNVAYKLLAADPNLNYSFEGLPSPKIVSNQYIPTLCP